MSAAAIAPCMSRCWRFTRQPASGFPPNRCKIVKPDRQGLKIQQGFGRAVAVQHRPYCGSSPQPLQGALDGEGRGRLAVDRHAFDMGKDRADHRVAGCPAVRTDARQEQPVSNRSVVPMRTCQMSRVRAPRLGGMLVVRLALHAGDDSGGGVRCRGVLVDGLRRAAGLGVKVTGGFAGDAVIAPVFRPAISLSTSIARGGYGGPYLL